MPERPDLEYVVPILARELRGARITGVRVKKPVVLRVAVPGKIDELLTGRSFGAVERRAHFVIFELGDLTLVVAPMLAGRFTLAPLEAKSPGDLAVALALEDGRELRYRDDVQMGKVYVIARGDRAKVPGLAAVGIDVLSPEFTREALRRIVKGRRDQVKVFLMDKAALDAMGNAYADEVLWAARLHPKTFTGKLQPEEIDRLHDAIVEVLSSARAEIARRAPPLDEKLRDFLKVRGRNGQPCPRCGSKIRSAGVHGHDAEFCPTCQPEPRSGIVDWSRAASPPPPAADEPGKPPPGARRRRR
jgi:formamidopyrimidine-DNA glycosylase